MTERYVAYVGTYTHGKSKGIHIYDIDPQTWAFTERKVVPINNPSDLVISKDERFLYSIADEGVRSFRILPDGDLESMNANWTGAMRGRDLEIDEKGEHLFIGGYYDGSITMMALHEDGTVGELLGQIFHENSFRGMSSDRSDPHVDSVNMMPDQISICVADSGSQNCKIYNIVEGTEMVLDEIVRMELNSIPIRVRVHKKLPILYVLCKGSNSVEVFRFEKDGDQYGEFERIQSIPVINQGSSLPCSVSVMEFSPDGQHLFIANNGVNSLSVLSVDPETGLLEYLCQNYTGGYYPKAIAVMPDNQHVAVALHDSDEIFFLNMNYEKKYFLMSAKRVKVEQPNCILLHKLGGQNNAVVYSKCTDLAIVPDTVE